MAVTQRRMTLEEFLELPEQEPTLEYIDGEVSEKVSPQGQHSSAQGGFLEFFNSSARPRRLARAFPELRVTFEGWSPVPDISIYTWERIPRDERGRTTNRFIGPPDIAIEIVSPGQRVNPLITRCLWYVANGVRIALLIDPDDESIIDFRPGGQARALRGTDVLDLSEVLPDFQRSVQAVFDAVYDR